MYSVQKTEEYKRDICKRSYLFAVRIVKLCTILDTKGGTSRTLANQILRSETSVGANIREAQSAESDRDFLHKLEISLKEARETEYWLELLIDANIIEKHLLEDLLNEYKKICKILISIISKIKQKIKQ